MCMILQLHKKWIILLLAPQRDWSVTSLGGYRNHPYNLSVTWCLGNNKGTKRKEGGGTLIVSLVLLVHTKETTRVTPLP